MVALTNSDAAAAAVISRRDAIIGALAIAAGALVATKPDPADALDGAPVTVGGIHIGASAGTVFWWTSTGTIGTVYSQAILAGRTGAGLHRALEGEVYASAGAAAAGVRGSAVAAGQFAVLADCAAPGGTALRVNGVASFSRSGRGSISHGHAGTTVTVPSGVATGALILVTLQGSAGSGVYLRYAKRTTATTFQVVLNKTATSKVSFAWMILN